MPNEFDADMEALGLSPVEGVATPTPGEPGATPTPVAGTPIKALGREFKSTDELVKAHEALYKDYTKKSQLAAKADEWTRFEAYLANHPELRSNISKNILDYQKRVNEGQNPASAQAASGIPPQMAQQLNDLQARYDDMALKTEIDELKGRYNLDTPTLDRVLKESEENDGIPLEKAYRIVIADEALARQKASTSAERARLAAEAKKANVGSSSAPNISPSPKDLSKLSDAEVRNRGSSYLEQFGIKD